MGPRHDTSRKPVGKRKELRTQGLPSGWHALCVTMPESALASLDAEIARLRASGVTKMSRSRLIRIALRVADPDVVLAAAREEAAGRVVESLAHPDARRPDPPR
jgi:hypothetical protein